MALWWYLTIILVLIHGPGGGYADPENQPDIFYPFGDTVGDRRNPKVLDSSSGSINLTVSFPFFDDLYDVIFVNMNGVLSFLGGVQQFTPDPFPLPETDGRPMIAPFWSDVDLRFSDGGEIYWRQTTDSAILARARDDVLQGFPAQINFHPTLVFIATWDEVAFYFHGLTSIPWEEYYYWWWTATDEPGDGQTGAGNGDGDGSNTTFPTARNSYQAVLVTDGQKSFIIFNYGDIEWGASTDSGGNDSGLGGISGQAGFNQGDGLRFYSIPGSRTDAILDVEHTSNVGIPGRWIFRSDQADVAVGGCTDVGILAVGPVAGSPLGGFEVILAGPCLEPDDNIKCRFDTEEVPGEVIDAARAKCVVPPVLRRRGRIPLFVAKNENYTHIGVFFVGDENPLVTLDPNTDWSAGESPLSISWSTDDTDSPLLDVDLVAFAADGGQAIADVIPLATSVPNTGSFDIPSRLLSNDPLHWVEVGAVRVSPAGTSPDLIGIAIWSEVHQAAEWYLGLYLYEYVLLSWSGSRKRRETPLQQISGSRYKRFFHSELLDRGKEVLEDLGDEISDAKDAVVEKIDDAKEVVSDVVDKVIETGEDIKDTVTEVIEDTVDKVNEAKDVISEAVNDVVDDAVETAGEVKDKVSDFIDSAVDKANEVKEKIEDTVDDIIETGADIVEDAIDEARDLANDVKDAAEDLVDEVIDQAGAIKDAIADILGEVFCDLKEAIEDAIDAVIDTLGDIFDRVKDLIDDILDTISEVTDAIRGVVDDVKDFIKSLWDSLNIFNRLCCDWYDNELLNPPVMDVPPCPTTLWQMLALHVPGGFETDPGCNPHSLAAILGCAIHHPGAYWCFRSSNPSPSGAGQQCCYNEGGALLPADQGGGTFDRVHYKGLSTVNFGVSLGGIISGSIGDFSFHLQLNMQLDVTVTNVPAIGHFLADVVPFWYCCKLSDNCHKYYEVRPTDDGSTYVPPRPAWTGGDPHIQTMDGLSYTFNGKGEFILSFIDGNFTLQGRAETINDGSGNPTATVWTAVAAKSENPTSDTVQVQVGGTVPIQALVNGMLEEFENMLEQAFSGVTIRMTADFRTVDLFFDNGVYLQVTSANDGVLNLLFLLPDAFRGLTTGLLGNFDDDESNDLRTPSDVVIDPGSSLSDIHNNFGLKWFVNESDSLFTYRMGTNYAYYKDEDFAPLLDITPTPEAIQLCGSEEEFECIYDFMATNNAEIAQETQKHIQQYQEVLNNTEIVLTCGFLPTPEHGEQHFTDSAVGSDVTFSCDTGYELLGSIERTCLESRDWSGTTTQCRNINECALDACGDSEHVHCNDTEGSYICYCDEGFVWNPSSLLCDDINECMLDLHHCHHICHNDLGSYYCSCYPGYALNGDYDCEDVDECAVSPPVCAQDCTNTNGSFICSCGLGYVLAEDGVNCTVTDICLIDHLHQCEQLCETMEDPTQYMCSCIHGYQLHTNRHACQLVRRPTLPRFNLIFDGDYYEYFGSLQHNDTVLFRQKVEDLIDTIASVRAFRELFGYFATRAGVIMDGSVVVELFLETASLDTRRVSALAYKLASSTRSNRIVVGGQVYTVMNAGNLAFFYYDDSTGEEQRIVIYNSCSIFDAIGNCENGVCNEDEEEAYYPKCYCDEDYIGDTCSEKDDEKGINLALLLPLVVIGAVLLLVVFIVIICCCIFRKRDGRYKENMYSRPTSGWYQDSYYMPSWNPWTYGRPQLSARAPSVASIY